MSVNWRVIPSWAQYEASTAGDIRRSATGRVLSKSVDSHGYSMVYLNGKESNRKSRSYKVAKLVAEAYHGPRPDGLTINHIDSVKSNDAPTNLEYCTVGDNVRHAVRMGLFPTGDRHGMRTHPERRAVGSRQGLSKLTEDQVIEIRKRYDPKTTSFRKMGREYGVDKRTIHLIVKREIWKHV